jgi:hypothetical protein
MTHTNRQRHYNSCIKRYEKIIEEKDNIIEENGNIIAKKDKTIIDKDRIISDMKIQLEIYKELAQQSRKTVEEIAKQPRSQNNNVTNKTTNNLNMLTPMDMNVEDFGKIINDSFTKDYLLNGQKGAARFTVDKILKDSDGKLKYVCTDTSRQIYRFKTPDGLVQKDFKANKLSSVLVDNLTKKSHSITNDEIEKNTNADVFVLYTNNFQDIRDMSQDNGDFRTELAVLTSV